MPNPLHKDNQRVAAVARACLRELEALGNVMVSQQVAMALGFAEALLDELATTADAGEAAPMIGAAAARILETSP